MTDDNFTYALNKTLVWEGGYADDQNDPGGETNMGISKRSYPELDIADLTQDQVATIYKRDFWLPLRCDSYDREVAAKLFDLAVNMGQRAAVKIVQRAVNYMAGRPFLVIDGVLGDRTERSIKQCTPKALLGAMRSEASNYYMSIASNNPSLRRYLHGWLNRAVA